MNQYLRWNNAIAEHFFNLDMAGRSVHLYVNSRLISELEGELGAIAGSFIDAVQEGPLWTTRQGICQRALQACQGWRARGLDYPPYIAYLGVFVLAGGTDGDFDPNAYYPRLRDLLGDPGDGMFPSFNRMQELWDDLETWSGLDGAGELGLFHARTIGGHVHIGYPLAQSLLTEQERKALPRIFYAANLDPTTTPPADELARALRSPVSRELLRPRTIRLVESQDDADHYKAILDAVADELAEWDGETQGTGQGGRPTKLASAGLRIGLDLDLVARTATASIRCRLKREFPEDGLNLEIPGIPGEFLAEEYMEGWSLPVSTGGIGEMFDSSRLDWNRGVALKTGQPGLHLRLPGRPARVFIEGTSEGIPGLIEVHALPRSQSFYLAYRELSWPRLEQWATVECRGFNDLDVRQGLPTGWKLAYISEATGNESVRHEFPFLSYPPSSRLRLVGGIRSSRGNNFFSFAPPDVALEGGTQDAGLYCNDVPMNTRVAGGAFVLPNGLPSESRITLEAKTSIAIVARHSMFLTGDFSLPSLEPARLLDSAVSPALRTDSNGPSIAGAHVLGELPVHTSSTAELLEDLKSELGSTTCFLVGPVPGQVAEWPHGELPATWRPVWAIKMLNRRNGDAIFLRESPDGASPRPGIAGRPREVRTWKKLIWYWRKRITPPALRTLRGLWEEFREVARNV